MGFFARAGKVKVYSTKGGVRVSTRTSKPKSSTRRPATRKK